MGNFSIYFKSMMLLATITMTASFILAYDYHYDASACMIVMSFCFWFGGINAPDEEKYVKKVRRNHRKR